MEFTREILDSLGAAFPDDELEFLPRATSNGKALALPYIDARSVMRRSMAWGKRGAKSSRA